MSEAAKARRNRVELAGTIASAPERRTTPAGTPVVSFRLRVEGDPRDAAVPECEVPIVCLGPDAATNDLLEGRFVEVAGSLTERRWKGPGGTRKTRFEVLARTLRVV